MKWTQLLREVPDFPAPGVLFRDILPVMADPQAWQDCLAALEALLIPLAPDVVMAPEARGYLLAAPLADRRRASLVPVRKPGKLPGPVLSQPYALEYGESRLEIEQGIQLERQRIVVVDDVLATGGTVTATAELAERGGGVITGFLFLIELENLGGRERLARWNVPVVSALAL
jgi:adenine phosphoribosyltransferase